MFLPRGRPLHRPRAAALALAGASLLAGLALPRQESAGARAASSGPTGGPTGGPASVPAPPRPGSEGCLSCHEGIEDMHPAAELSCVDCHGGDATTREKLHAHVQPANTPPGDERVPPREGDLAYRRFVNPMDLRVVDRTCGDCHAQIVADLEHSLHGTTAGHLSDGFYEMGLLPDRQSRYAVFPVRRRGAEGGGLEALASLPAYDDRAPQDVLATHYPDLVRKECMQCHLWSQGNAVRGRVGFDGDYRGAGCAACHVPYARDGLSDSADRRALRTEPGHPWRHTMTAAPTTQACTSCHYGDASVGMHFRGLSQLPPGAAGGPDVPGTTDAPLHRAFFLDDAAMCPPDVHHERGMHCIDCHTAADVMGDGMLHGKMEHAVEISCEACHGTFDTPSELRTERGTPLEHLFRVGDQVFLRSKVTGARHPVVQVAHVLDRGRPEFNAEAARAMTPEHAALQCYTCHAGWNVNFLGFHFYRNAALSQLDLLSGRRTPGRVTTQEKVFSTWKSFYAGLDESGRVAPYLTGFSTMGTVDGAGGERLLDQVMPVTAEGLSGVTMIHHQLHSVRPTARSCVECHRSPATWGLGSPNFRLARQLAFVADRRGIEVVALDRANLAASAPLAKIVLPDVVDLALDCDELQGHARFLYAAEGGRGVHVIDVRDPLAPRRVAFVPSAAPRALALAGSRLYLADGEGGLVVHDVSEPAAIERLAVLPMVDARALRVQWPWIYLADGLGGLVIADLRASGAPRIVGGMALPGEGGRAGRAVDLAVLFQHSRPLADPDNVALPRRTPARHLCVVLDEARGPVLFDVTEPTHPTLLWPRPTGRSEAPERGNASYRSLALLSHVDLAPPQGGARTQERDLVYLLEERELANGGRNTRLNVWDVSDPEQARRLARVPAGDASEMLLPLSVYNQPFLQRMLLVLGSAGAYVIDASRSAAPTQAGALAGIGASWAAAVEEFPLDRMLDEDDRRLKDVSHPGSRWLRRGEIARLLDVPARLLGHLPAHEGPPEWPARSARAFFERLDADGDGVLRGEERAQAGERSDLDGDGRVTLAELAQLARPARDGPTEARAEEPRYLERRGDPDGDLARLFDGVDPHAFDSDRDGRLDRGELSRALFAALDLDGNGRVDLAELSRHPGELRRLRLGDLTPLEGRYRRHRLERGGSLAPRDVTVEDAEFAALDLDGDGEVQLAVEPSVRQRTRPKVDAPPEWPARRERVIALPPNVTLERLLATFDGDGDGALDRRELRQRPDLLAQLDTDRDGVVGPEELERALALVAARGVDLCPDGFLERWDLDGSGAVEDGELPAAARIVRRRPGVSGR